MSITAAKYLDNSTIQITTSYSAGAALSTMTTFATFAATIADAITGNQPGSNGTLSGVAFTGTTTQSSSGWTLFDSYWGGKDTVAGTVSPVYTQVFRSANVLDSAGASSYKNIILRYNTREGTINTSTCEYWDIEANYKLASPGALTTANRIPTNEAWTHFDCSPVGYNLTACDIIVMVSPRWCFLHSYLNNESSMWSGVVEMAREDIMDTADASYPCWGWIGSGLWALGATSLSNTVKPLNNVDYPLICLPRTRTGLLGAAAARSWASDYGTASYPSWVFNTGGPFTYYLGNAANKFITNAWDASRRLAMPIKPIYDFAGASIANYGQIYGMKVLAPVGTNMNKITIPTDSNGNASATGTDRNHWLLNVHHKTFSTDNTSWFPGVTAGNTTWTVENIATTGAVKPISMISTGIAYYMITRGGASITKIDAINKVAKATVIFTIAGITDIKYDGERFIYVTSTTAASALMRIDTIDDTYVTWGTSITGGLSAIALNGTTVCASGATASATPTFYRFVRAAQNAASASAIAADTTATQTVTTLTDATSVVKDLISNFEGDFIAAVYSGVAAKTPIIKLPAVGTIGTFLQAGTAAVISTNQGLQILDGGNFLLWYASGTNLYQVQFDPRTATPTLIGSITSVAHANTLVAGGTISSAKVQGALIVCFTTSTLVNLFAVNSLGKLVSAVLTTQLGAPLAQIDQGTSLAMSSTLLGNNFVFHDGARLFLNNDTSLKIFTNVNGGNSIGGNPTATINMGQVAIPA